MSTHIHVETNEVVVQENITFFKLPPHSSYLLQPLDISGFKPFKTKWDEELNIWQRQNDGQKLAKKVFSQLLFETWTQISQNIIKKGFRKPGIFPYNRNIIPEEKFRPDALKR